MSYSWNYGSTHQVTWLKITTSIHMTFSSRQGLFLIDAGFNGRCVYWCIWLDNCLWAWQPTSYSFCADCVKKVRIFKFGDAQGPYRAVNYNSFLSFLLTFQQIYTSVGGRCPWQRTGHLAMSKFRMLPVSVLWLQAEKRKKKVSTGSSGCLQSVF